MAKAARKRTAARQQSKYRPPERPRETEKIVVFSIGDARFLDDHDELVQRGNIEAPAWHRERKERYFRNLIDSADKAKMTDRKWFRVSEIADVLATLPGTIIPNTTKSEGVLTFLCEEILRGAFNDQKGRSQIANLHSSPVVPVRFNTKGITRAEIPKFTEYLWIKRQACLNWFARKKLNVPEDWVPSGLDAQNSKPVQARYIGTKATAERVTRDYIEQAEAEGYHPTQDGLIKAAKSHGYRGGRNLLRKAFNETCWRNERGRPEKINRQK
jgi:hypothetical protein